jgi:hypothetical protein
VKPVGVAIVVFGILQILFRGAFSGFDKCGSMNGSTAGSPPSTPSRAWAFGWTRAFKVVTTVIFRVFFVIAGAAVVVWG